MERCDCYETRTETAGPWKNNYLYGVCLGTREVEMCNCGGDESKCTFYPEKRKAAIKPMNTAEMYIKANENGKTYYSESVDAFYSKEFGLVEAEDTTQKVQIGDFPTFEYLMQREWEEVKAMTKAEAEKKYKIRIVD